MATFLAWLYGVADRVYQWFGSAWAVLYAGASNAWTWAVTQATAAYNNAKSYAYGLFASLQNDIAGLGNWVSYQLGLIQTQLANIRLPDLSTILSWISTQLAPVMAAINDARSYAAGLVNAALADVRTFVTQQIAAGIQDVRAAFAWIETIRAQLTALITQVTGADLANLIQFARTAYAQLSQFLANPVGWILDVLSADLIAALSWLIAIGLGAVDDTIPNNPPWKH